MLAIWGLLQGVTEWDAPLRGQCDVLPLCNKAFYNVAHITFTEEEKHIVTEAC